MNQKGSFLIIVGILLIIFIVGIGVYLLRPGTKNNQSLSERTKIAQDRFHSPTVNGEKIEPKAYLTLPFSKKGAGNIKINEGWLYSYDEYQIHGMEVHVAVDFHAPYGTAVYAPADGYAMSSYFTLPVKIQKKEITYKGKAINYGLGLFVRMYIPLAHRFLDLAHLSEIDNAIPFSEPEYDEEKKEWKPTNEKISMNEIPSHPEWVKVTKGQFLGRVGTSGLSWGYEDFTDKPQRKVTYDPKTQVSWDDSHLHFEEFSEVQDPQKDEVKGQKTAPRDIYGIYSFEEEYPQLDQKLDPRFKALILTSEDGRPLFAK